MPKAQGTEEKRREKEENKGLNETLQIQNLAQGLVHSKPSGMSVIITIISHLVRKTKRTQGLVLPSSWAT